jgi:two-component system sensor histidine kinase QseC
MPLTEPLKKYLSSIKRRTLAAVLSLLMVTGLTSIVISYYTANHEVEELFDARLAQQARLLMTVNRDIGAQPQNTEPVYLYQNVIADQEEASSITIGHDYESKVFFQVWRNDQLLFASDAVQLIQQSTEENGFGFAQSENYLWRTFTLSSTSAGEILKTRVAEREDVRSELVSEIVLQSLLPELVSWLLVIFSVWLGIGVGLRPLRKMAQSIRNINPTELQPIEEGNLPEELLPIRQAINRLLVEIDQVMEREKRWIADAAHELRTPLAVLKLHAQNAEDAANEQERQQSLQQLQQGVERATRVVSQLLVLARLEHENKLSEPQPLDLIKTTRSLIADMLPLAWQKKLDIQLQVDEQERLLYPIEQSHLEILVQNLLSNAIKFSRTSSNIEVQWQKINSTLELTVIDHGCGIEAQQRERLSERFYHYGESSGAGLGLSIVQTLLEHYRGELRYLDTEGGGLTVRAELPCY